jgi:hypothetical protein
MYMNNELQKISNWFRSNKMAINTAKTKFIVFRTRGKRIDPEDCILIFNNNEIGKPENPSLLFPITKLHNDGAEKIFKLLGVLFDKYLSFDDHISHLCKNFEIPLLHEPCKEFYNSECSKNVILLDGPFSSLVLY